MELWGEMAEHAVTDFWCAPPFPLSGKPLTIFRSSLSCYFELYDSNLPPGSLKQWVKITGFLADPLVTARPVTVTSGTVTGLLVGTGGDSGITQTGSSSLGERTTLPSGDGDDDSD